jgi:hypothetical protein
LTDRSDPNDRTHDGGGRFIRVLSSVERDAEAAKLRARGHTYDQIATELGYSDRSNARDGVMRCLDATVAEPAAEVRKIELDRLDYLWRKGLEVLERDHITVQHGKVIRRQVGVERHKDGIEKLDPDGKPIPIYEDLLDDEPVLRAIAVLVKISERRARLQGLDTPVKADLTIHAVDPMDTAIAEIIRDAQAKNALEEAALKGETEGTE